MDNDDDNDDLVKKLEKHTSQVDDFIREMDKVIASNKELIAGNRRKIVKHQDKIDALKTQQSHHDAIARYARESRARMRNDTCRIRAKLKERAKGCVASAVAQEEAESKHH